MPRDTRVIRSVIPMQADRPPLSPNSAELMDFALQRIRESTVPSEFARMGKLSIVAFRIAKDLAEAAAIEVGAEPLPWEELTSVARERFRYLAERAISTLDPDKRVDAAHEAVVDVAEWYNGPFDGVLPTVEDVARKSIWAFEQRLFEKVGQP